MRWTTTRAIALLCAGARVTPLGRPSCVSFAAPASSVSAFAVAHGGSAAPFLLSADDCRACSARRQDLASDIKEVTGHAPTLANATATYSVKGGALPIIVGTLGKSSLIDAVVSHANLNVSAVKGQWEAYFSKVVKNPLPGVSEAYVIIGADKRGTTFALYDHSEQFGVSPWYYWADVPVTTHSSLYVSASGCAHGSPTVKYRGIFLNDEQPALQNWAQEKFSNSTGALLTGSPFNHFFYTKLFELILRLKANYLWPAQWSSGFAIDDPLNQFYADLYGIVMGTSHEEPMMRSTPVEWGIFGSGPWDFNVNAANLTEFWKVGVDRSVNYESMYSIGMRGDGDEPLTAGQDISLLENIVSVQRGLLQTAYNGTNITTIPQIWCLYKEVQAYYEAGMTVPDDVTLLWTDDNWGNIRRFPLETERNRSGGAGVYYHFDYVGTPRDYKWVQSTQIAKTFEQMSVAVDSQADRVWIVNVGDMKPYHLDIEFFLSYGWDASIWNKDNLDSFVEAWAEREFAVSKDTAATVAEIIGNVTRWNARRKPELINGTTYSLTNYREAENVVAGWQALSAASTKIYNSLPSGTKPAYFQLVHHVVEASSTVGQMWIASGESIMRAQQARQSTNNYADQVETLFENDWELENQYHTMLDGKWDHMMDQSHTTYYYWQQPMSNAMPPLSRLPPKKQALPGPMRISPEGTLGTWPGDNQNQCAALYNCPNPIIYIDRYLPQKTKFVDVGAGGPNAFTYTATANVSWVTLSTAKGSVSPTDPESRVEIGVDWDNANVTGVQYAAVTFNASLPASTKKVTSTTVFVVYVVANHTTVPSSFSGFVEGDGGIAFEAAHASRNTSVDGVSWEELPGYGRTLSGVTPYPRLGNNFANYTAGSGPSLEYDFYNFNTVDGQNVSITAYVSPSMNAFGNASQLAFGLQVDGGAATTERFMPLVLSSSTPAGWDGVDGFVANSIVPVTSNFTASPGPHTLKVWMIEPTVVLQKFVINTGNVRASYLGPPESIKV